MNKRLLSSGTPFLITKEYRRFAEFCDACRRHRYIGLCYGPPGVGKTLSARHYAQWDMVQQHWQDYFCAPAASLASCHTILYTPTVANSARSVEKEIEGLHFRFNCLVDQAVAQRQGEDRDIDRDYCELMLVDEADRLKTASLEQLRDIYDRTQVGVVLIGMPGLEKRLARYPQLYSRVGFAHQFRPLSRDELTFILTQKWEQLGLTLELTDFTDAEAVAAVIRITGGNFRLLQRLFAQVERILQINELHTITQEVVEAAREGLVIGVV